MSYPDLVFKTSVNPYRMAFGRNQNDLAMTNLDTGERIVFVDYFIDGWLRQEIHFTGENGTILRREQVEETLANGGIVPDGVDLSGSGTLQGSAYADTFEATGYGTQVAAGGGNDLIVASAGGNDYDFVFDAGEGRDSITGGYARDIYRFDRGDGHDVIIDDVRRAGPDIAAYFAAVPSTDTYQDRVEFGAGIAPADVTAARVGDNLTLSIAGSEDSLTIMGWYDGTLFNKIENFWFADGTSWLASDIDRRLGESTQGLEGQGGGTLLGSQYDDQLIADTYGTQLSGGAGNDRLAATVDGGVFGLVFDGGAGADTLVGSYAADTYRWGRGSGKDVVIDDVRAMGEGVAAYFYANRDTATTYHDRLEIGPGVLPSNLYVQVFGNDLVLTIRDTQDSIRLAGWQDGTLFNKIETIVFADGPTWTWKDLHAWAALPITSAISGSGLVEGTPWYDKLTATAYGTQLSGGAEGDILRAVNHGSVYNIVYHGGTGLDQMYGTYAGDTYVFHRGDGSDFITDDVRVLGKEVADFFLVHPETESYHDKIVFGPGIAPSDIVLERTWEGSLVFGIKDTTDKLYVQKWFDGTDFCKIERVLFEDGTVWTARDLDAKFSRVAPGLELSGAGTLVGTDYGDWISLQAYGARGEGRGGNDDIRARVDGSVFDLTFIGGTGNDYLRGSYARDFYYFNLGDGHDVIHDDVRDLSYDTGRYFLANPTMETYQDHLFFGEGIRPQDVVRTRDDLDLVLTFNEHDSIRFIEWFSSATNRIEVIGFADGTVWNPAMAHQGLI